MVLQRTTNLANGLCWASLAMAMIAGSCATSEVSLLEDDSASRERLRRMDLVIEKNIGNDTWEIVEDATTVADIQGWVLDHCNATVAETAAFSGCAVESGCDLVVCTAQVEMCRALTFREMAEGENTVVLHAATDYRVAPQDAESRIALWQASQYASMLALEQVSLGLLEKCTTNFEAQFNAGTESLEQSTGELLASTLVEALENGELAAHQGARGALGIADRDRAAISNLGLAARVSWFDRYMVTASARGRA